MTTATLTLTDFLLARIAEDEAACERVMKSTRTDSRWMLSANPAAATVGAHPARVLADCEAKRRIVALAIEAQQRMMDGPDLHADGTFHTVSAWMRDVLCRLALPYSDHDDYRSEWAV